MQKLVAMWNTVRGVWEKPETGGLLCEHSEPFLETWPTSGSMRSGQAFEQPTQVRPITDSESSSLLRTPTAAEVEGGPVSPEVAKAKGQTLRLTGQILALLPAPVAADGQRGNTHYGFGNKTLFGAVNGHSEQNWDEFEPAIRLWEKITGRPAPAPTVADGQKGQHRLAAKFPEWLMGLPAGWITDHGLHRKDEIKMAGNGVVPQQAKLALEILLNRYDVSGGED